MALTANQIVTLACQALKVTGYVQQAQQLLNVVLADLADTQDLDLLRGIYSGITLATGAVTPNAIGIQPASGPYSLPLDYKRAEWKGVWYNINNVPYKLISLDLSQFYDQVQQAGIGTYPEFYATDTSPLADSPPSNPQLFVWPPSSVAVPLYVQYRRLLPDINWALTSPAAGIPGANSVPWFPNQDYLLAELKAQLADLVDDSRAAEFRANALQKLDRFMKLTNDDEGRAQTMKLDRRSFGQGYASLPNTKSIGW